MKNQNLTLDGENLCGEAIPCLWSHIDMPVLFAGERNMLHFSMASRVHHINLVGSGGDALKSSFRSSYNEILSKGQQSIGNSSGSNGSSSSRRDHNIDYSALFVQLSGTFPTLYRCVSCHKTVSNRWHHANIHRPQRHSCPVCNQVFTRRDNMKAHCKVKHADQKDIFYPNLVHMWSMIKM